MSASLESFTRRGLEEPLNHVNPAFTSHPRQAQSGDSTRVFLGMTAVIHSEPMQRLLELVERVAATDATVLITGESGTGKELVARALHHYSRRSDRPWVDVSCAALPEHLVESELFGYEKGAFSGAQSSKPGLFELAHRGTLFLDEIGELEPRMQVKLLRVLDGTPYYRLGGVRKVSVEVRILAATNQDLQQMVAAGRFRTDLYHRLAQIQIDVPPLRERRDDIMPLSGYFLRQHGGDLYFADDARCLLESYRWPGNVRELRNVVMKAAVLAQSTEIRAADLPELWQQLAPGSLEAPLPRPGSEGVREEPPTSLLNLERQMIFQVLERTGGHHQKAADLLGISRRTLTRKLKLYAMEAAAEACSAERTS